MPLHRRLLIGAAVISLLTGAVRDRGATTPTSDPLHAVIDAAPDGNGVTPAAMKSKLVDAAAAGTATTVTDQTEPGSVFNLQVG